MKISKEDACGFRTAGSYRMFTNHNYCYDQLIISKYLHRDMVCYEIGLKNRSKLQSMEYLYESEAYALILYISMNTKYFKKVNRMTAYVHEDGSSKIVDASASFYHLLNDDHYVMRVSYQTLFMNRLQPPYDTMCRFYGTDGSRIEWNLHRIQEETIKDIEYVNSKHDDISAIKYTNIILKKI